MLEKMKINLIKDVMTSDVVTAKSGISIVEAKENFAKTELKNYLF